MNGSYPRHLMGIQFYVGYRRNFPYRWLTTGHVRSKTLLNDSLLCPAEQSTHDKNINICFNHLIIKERFTCCNKYFFPNINFNYITFSHIRKRCCDCSYHTHSYWCFSRCWWWFYRIHRFRVQVGGHLNISNNLKGAKKNIETKIPSPQFRIVRAIL